MQEVFQMHFSLLNRMGEVRKSPYSLVILREGQYSVSVDRVPLVEYYVYFDNLLRSDQLKLKFYKTLSEGKWYDGLYSEEAEWYSPEFGIPEMNGELKSAIDAYETTHAHTDSFSR